MKSKRFMDKIVLVTGGNSGMGRATAKGFAEEGAKVVITARREDLGEQVVEEIKANGGEAFFVRTDVTKPDDIDNLFKTVVETYGRLDIAFNNAGAGSSAPYKRIHYTTDQSWNYLMDTNLRAVWLCMKHELSLMVKQNGGVIVNNSSILGLIGEPFSSIYVASKHGLVGLTKSVANEYAQKNIRINAVCPGYIETDMISEKNVGEGIQRAIISRIPMGRLGKPEEIAGAVLWLCSNEASFVTGHAMVIDGGQSVI